MGYIINLQINKRLINGSIHTEQKKKKKTIKIKTIEKFQWFHSIYYE